MENQTTTNQTKNHSGFGTAALVLGIIGAVLSFIPIINNVAFFLGIIPVGKITGQRKVDLSLLQLGFLNTENICISFMKKIKKAFLDTGTQSVDIPGNQFHSILHSFN